MAIRKNKLTYIDHPLYDCRIATGVNGPVGFFVKLFLIFSDDITYTLYSQAEWIDNINLIRESGYSCTSFTYDLLVTPTQHPNIYLDINRYVSETNLH